MTDASSVSVCVNMSSCVLQLCQTLWNAVYTINVWAPRLILNVLFPSTIPPPAVASYVDALCSDCTMLGQLKLRWETSSMYMFMDLIALLVGCFFIVAFIFRWRWPPPDDPAIAVVEEEQSPPYPTN